MHKGRLKKKGKGKIPSWVSTQAARQRDGKQNNDKLVVLSLRGSKLGGNFYLIVVLILKHGRWE